MNLGGNNLLDCIIVGIGGFIGTVCRYLIGLLPIGADNAFPIKTLTINVIGSFLIALITALSVKNSELNPQVVLMLRVGVCGGFTTFSTFAYESTELMKNGQTMLALGYVCASIFLGVLAIFLAQMIVN